MRLFVICHSVFISPIFGIHYSFGMLLCYPSKQQIPGHLETVHVLVDSRPIVAYRRPDVLALYREDSIDNKCFQESMM